MIRRPPRSTRTTHSFPTRRSSDLRQHGRQQALARFLGVQKHVARRLGIHRRRRERSEEHTSELQSLMRISYAVFCLKKKKEHRIQRLRQKMLTKAMAFQKTEDKTITHIQ